VLPERPPLDGLLIAGRWDLMAWCDEGGHGDAILTDFEEPEGASQGQGGLELLQTDPKMTWQLAAAAAGISTVRFRRALKLPHVAQWARTEHKNRVDAICAANPERLRVIANTSENHMARVSAIKTLEAMKEALDPNGGCARLQQTPGVVIVIQHRDGSEADVVAESPLPPAPLTIEAESERAADLD
jgi:hypothetical protein